MRIDNRSKSRSAFAMRRERRGHPETRRTRPHRIVLLCRRVRRLPAPGLSERAFLAELEAGGIHPGEYNLPDWEENNAGFQKCLDALFRLTPPTALIVDETPYFVAALQFLTRRGIRVPATSRSSAPMATPPSPAASRPSRASPGRLHRTAAARGVGQIVRLMAVGFRSACNKRGRGAAAHRRAI